MDNVTLDGEETTGGRFELVYESREPAALRLRPPVTRVAAQHVRDLTEHEAGLVAEAYRARCHARLEEARASDGDARSRATADAPRLAAAEDDLAHAEPGNWITALTFPGCALVCFAAEFTLTWAALPFLLSVPRYSLLGVALGLAPPTAIVILDWLIARLIEDPWQAYRTAPSSWRRRLVTLAMALFLIAVIAGNIHAVSLVAEAREEAMHTRQVLETGDDVALDRGVVRRAVLAISIWVAVDGALFLLAGGRDLRRVIRHAALAIVAGIRRRRHQSLVARQIRTASTLATRQRDWERADEQARLLAESFRQRRLLDLEQASRQAGANRTSLDLVNAVLASAVWSPRARADH